MNETERARQKIESQLSQGREATIEGVSKEMKNELSWTYVEDGCEVSATHHDDGTYDLTIRENSSSVSSSNHRLSRTEQREIIENNTPDFAQNQVEVYLTDKRSHQKANMEKLWQAASEGMKEANGSVPLEKPSMETVLLSDGYNVAAAPLYRFAELPLEMELEYTSSLLEIADESGVLKAEYISGSIALMRLALGESVGGVEEYPDWTEELLGANASELNFRFSFPPNDELNRMLQLISEQGLFGEPCIVAQDGDAYAVRNPISIEGLRVTSERQYKKSNMNSPLPYISGQFQQQGKPEIEAQYTLVKCGRYTVLFAEQIARDGAA